MEPILSLRCYFEVNVVIYSVEMHVGSHNCLILGYTCSLRIFLFLQTRLLFGGSVACAGNNRPSSAQIVWHVTVWKARVKNDVNNEMNNEFHLAACVSASWCRGSVSHWHVLLGLLDRTEPSWLLLGTRLFFFSDHEKSKMYQSF